MRKFGWVLIALAGFTVAMAALVKFYAYPSLAKAPEEPMTTDGGQDQPGTYSISSGVLDFFNVATLKVEHRRLYNVQHVVGDSGAAESLPIDNACVYDSAAWVTMGPTPIPAETDPNDIVDFGRQHVIFDCTSGAADGAVGQTVDGKATSITGQVFKMPMNAQKQTYAWWDDSTKKAWPMNFVGEDEIQGLKVYHYRQRIPATVVEQRKVPPSVLHLRGDKVLTADMNYANVRDVWVEPETGAVIKGRENQNVWLAYGGQNRTKATVGQIGFTQDTIDKNVSEIAPQSQQLHMIRVLVPLIGLIVGLVLLAVGLVLVWLFHRKQDRVSSGEDVRHEQNAPVAVGSERA